MITPPFAYAKRSPPIVARRDKAQVSRVKR